MNLNRWKWKCLNSWKATVFEISGAVFWWNIRDIARWGKIFRNFHVPENFSWERQEGRIYSGNIHKLSKDGRWRHRVPNIFEFFPQDAIPTFPPRKTFFCGDSNTSDTFFPYREETLRGGGPSTYWRTTRRVWEKGTTDIFFRAFVRTLVFYDAATPDRCRYMNTHFPPSYLMTLTPPPPPRRRETGGRPSASCYFFCPFLRRRKVNGVSLFVLFLSFTSAKVFFLSSSFLSLKQERRGNSKSCPWRKFFLLLPLSPHMRPPRTH